MSLYKAYIEENDAQSRVYESAYTLCRYQILPGGILINDLYVVPHKRSKGYGQRVANKLAAWTVKQGRPKLGCIVYKAIKDFDRNVQIYTQYGFKVTGEDAQNVYMLKELK